MFKQTDRQLNNSPFKFAEFGCGLFDIVYLSAMFGKYIFSRRKFLMDCISWLDMKIIDEDTFINNWDRLASASSLGYRLVIENGTHKLPASRKLKPGELQLLYLYNPETGYRHFVVADENDNITYDSLGDSVTGKAYRRGVAYIESRRVFEKC